MEWLRREVLDVDMDEAEVIGAEAALAFGGPVCGGFCPAVQALGLEDAPDAVAVEMRQEVAHDEGEVIQGKVGGTTQAADDGALNTIALRMDIAEQPEEFMLDLPDCGALLWRDPGKQPAQGQPRRPAAGTCFEPPDLSYSTALFTVEHGTRTVGGFELELSLRGTVYAEIPVVDDRLDLARSKLAPGMSLVTARQFP